MSRLIRTGRRRPWWAPAAVIGYLALIAFPAFYLSIVVWEQSGADVVGEPVKSHAHGTVESCHHDGLLFVRKWYACEVKLDLPVNQTSKLPRVVTVQPPDLEPGDVGSQVNVEQRMVRGKTIYTTERNRPYNLYGFVGAVGLVGGSATGLVMVLRKLKGLPARRR